MGKSSTGASRRSNLEKTGALWQKEWEAIREIIERYGGATIAVVSHGDLIPALADYLAEAYEIGGVPDITRRGQWYEIAIEGGKDAGGCTKTGASHRKPPADLHALRQAFDVRAVGRRSGALRRETELGNQVVASGETLTGVGRWSSGNWSFEEFANA